MDKKLVNMYSFDVIFWPFQTALTGIREKIVVEVPVWDNGKILQLEDSSMLISDWIELKRAQRNLKEQKKAILRRLCYADAALKTWSTDFLYK